MEERIVYLNGAFVRESEAKVSVLDSGFNAGDGVYDVTRTFRHKPFKLREHTERLFRSLHYTRIDCGMSVDEMEKTTLEVLERNKSLLRENEDCALWQVVSRGVRSSTGNRVSGRATVAVYSVIVNFPEFAEFLRRGRAFGHPFHAADSAAVPRIQGEDHQQNEPQHGCLRSEASGSTGDSSHARPRRQSERNQRA